MKLKLLINLLSIIGLWPRIVNNKTRLFQGIYWSRFDNLYSSKLAPYDYEDSYNPFEHRVVDKPNTWVPTSDTCQSASLTFPFHSTLGALLHLLKSSLGTGILAMPNAFNNAGLLFGSVMTLIVGILCTHCVWILVSRHPLDNEETSFQAFEALSCAFWVS